MTLSRFSYVLTALTIVALFGACGPAGSAPQTFEKTERIPLLKEAQNGEAHAIFAGGCFWCMEPPFDKLDGVKATYSGYCGGEKDHPAYDEVAAGRTKYAESVLVVYDPAKVSYEQLLHAFWRSINPVQKNGQFYDVGPQYRTAVFYLNETQQKLAKASKAELAASGKFKEPIAVEISPATDFWKAEEYHQDFYKKNPAHYNRYRTGSGRDSYLERVWGKAQ